MYFVAGKMHTVAREVFHIPENKETRLWNKYTADTYEPLDKSETTLQVAYKTVARSIR